MAHDPGRSHQGSDDCGIEGFPDFFTHCPKQLIWKHEAELHMRLMLGRHISSSWHRFLIKAADMQLLAVDVCARILAPQGRQKT